MTNVALTDLNDRSVSPESVPESFVAYFTEVAHILDAQMPLNNIHLVLIWEKEFLATYLHIQALAQKFPKSLWVY